MSYPLGARNFHARFPVRSGLYSRNEDGDSNENGKKKALSLLSKTTTLHVQHTFFLYIFASTARLRRENHLISSQFVEDAYVNIRQRLFFSFTMKFDATWLHFLSDVFVTVVVVVACVPREKPLTGPERDCG